MVTINTVKIAQEIKAVIDLDFIAFCKIFTSKVNMLAIVASAKNIISNWKILSI